MCCCWCYGTSAVDRITYVVVVVVVCVVVDVKCIHADGGVVGVGYIIGGSVCIGVVDDVGVDVDVRA